MNVIELPYQIELRDYQKKAWDAFFVEKYKRMVLIWHRRAGKDKFSLNLTIAASQLRRGIYYYLFPQQRQARRDIWEGIGGDGKRFLDHFPKVLVKKINNTEMMIELHNGSIFRLCGSDRYDSLMGSNPVGIILAEYSLQNPIAWDYLRPILAENNGWALFQYTMRGMNHGYQLFETVRDNPKWFSQFLTVDHTLRADGTPVITQEMIEEERISGMSDDMIQQEYYCDHNAATKGAYFSKELKVALEQNRIKDFPIDTSLPVDTYWDLGMSDSTCIWLVQRLHNEIRCIAYYENCEESINHYINWLMDYRNKNGIVFGKHFGPHDVTARHLSTGKSTMQIAGELGFIFIRTPRIADKQVGIDLARSVFSRIWFHQTNCKQGLACLREYHKAYNETNQVYMNKPVHNWASHGADAFLTLTQNAHKAIFQDRGVASVQKMDWAI